MATLFIQNRTHRAGAQTALACILRHPDMRRWQPAVLCSRGGWLVDECERAAIPAVQEQFPRSRSLFARLYGNASFSRRARTALIRRSIVPSIICGNDHVEGILCHRLAVATGARSAIFLRSIAMTRDDFFKYRCDRHEAILAVGEELRARVAAWLPDRPIDLIHDGLSEDDFSPPKPRVEAPPVRVLVIGSAQELKGWRDLFAALRMLAAEGALPSLTFDFTGTRPALDGEDAELRRLVAERCRFLGRVESFKELILSYDLVINPSRMESFGMAAIETLAAGVPLLSSQTGVIAQVQEQDHMLFRPSEPAALARALRHLLTHWPEIDFGVVQAQAKIRSRFMIDRTVAQLQTVYRRLADDAAATGSRQGKRI